MAAACFFFPGVARHKKRGWLFVEFMRGTSVVPATVLAARALYCYALFFPIFVHSRVLASDTWGAAMSLHIKSLQAKVFELSCRLTTLHCQEYVYCGATVSGCATAGWLIR